MEDKVEEQDPNSGRSDDANTKEEERYSVVSGKRQRSSPGASNKIKRTKAEAVAHANNYVLNMHKNLGLVNMMKSHQN